VSAEPAAFLAGLLAPGLLNVLDAAVAAFFDVTLAGCFVCDRADPAADLADLLALGFLRTFEAADAAFFPVVSLFLAMVPASLMRHYM